MGKYNKQNNGVPYQKGYGDSSSNKHLRVRFNGYSVEGSGKNSVQDMKRASGDAVLNYGLLKQTEMNQEIGKRIGCLLIDKIFGNLVNTSKGSRDSNEQQKETQDPGEILPGRSFSEMLARPMSCENGVIAAGYILKGQITFCVAGSDSGKSIFAIDTGIAAASGSVPTYLPPTCQPSNRMNVIFYQLEERAGEIRKRYGAGNVFSGLPFQWIMRTDLQSPTQDSLIANIKGQCKRITKDTLIICDPLSKLDGFDAAKFIKEMETLQIEYAEKGVILSFFCTAHTEEDKPWKPLTSDQILGGDKLLQQAGSVFSIRQERGGKCYRFLQSLKPPKGEVDKETVSVIKFVGRDEYDPNSYTHLMYGCEKTIQNALPKKPKPEGDEMVVEPREKKGRGKLAGRDEEIVQRYLHGDTVENMAVDYDVSTQAIYDKLEKNGIQRKR